jgi:hypothetical protein
VVVGDDRIREAEVGVVLRERVEVAAVGRIEDVLPLAVAPAEVVAGLDVVDGLDRVLADVAEEHARLTPPALVPAEPVRVAHADGVDLAQRAGRSHERVRRRDAVRTARPVGARRVDAEDLARRRPHVLRDTRAHAPAAVAHGEVEQAVVGGAGPRRRVEVDLLDRVDLPREAEAQHLAARPRERVGRRVVGHPLGHHRVQERGNLRRVGGGVGRRPRVARTLGVHRVERAVVLEVRVERREPEPAAHAAPREEIGRELGGHVQVDLRLAVLHEVQRAVQVGHVRAARTVGQLAQAVDPGVPHEAAVDRRRDRLGLGELGVLVKDQAQRGLDLLGGRVGDRPGFGCRGRRRHGRRGQPGQRGSGDRHRGHRRPPSSRARGASAHGAS